MTFFVIFLIFLILSTIIYTILNGILGRVLNGLDSLLSFIPGVGEVKIIMIIGLKLCHLEIYVADITKNNNEVTQAKEINDNNITDENILSKIISINTEERKIFDRIKNLDTEKSDEEFGKFYEKYLVDYRQKYHYDSPTSLITDLKKLNLEYYEDKDSKTISINDVSLFYYTYNDGFVGFVPGFENLIETYNSILSPAWLNYFDLSSEEERDSSDFENFPASDSIRYTLCEKWAKKWEDFLYKYPNFPLKKYVEEEIKNYKSLINGDY